MIFVAVLIGTICLLVRLVNVKGALKRGISPYLGEAFTSAEAEGPTHREREEKNNQAMLATYENYNYRGELRAERDFFGGSPRY